MSGDLGAEVVVRAAARALGKHATLKLILVGDEGELEQHVGSIIGEEPRRPQMGMRPGESPQRPQMGMGAGERPQRPQAGMGAGT